MLGLFWLIKPENLQNRLKKKMSRRVRRIVYGFVLVFAFLMIGSAFRAPGFLSKIVAIIGMIIVIKVIMMITSKTSEKVFGWWADRPVVVFRAWALAVLAAGVFMVFIGKL